MKQFFTTFIFSSLTLGLSAGGLAQTSAQTPSQELKITLNSGWTSLDGCSGRVRYFADQNGQNFFEVQGSFCHEMTISDGGTNLPVPLTYLSEDIEHIDGFGNLVQIDGAKELRISLSTDDGKNEKISLAL